MTLLDTTSCAISVISFLLIVIISCLFCGRLTGIIVIISFVIPIIVAISITVSVHIYVYVVLIDSNIWMVIAVLGLVTTFGLVLTYNGNSWDLFK